MRPSALNVAMFMIVVVYFGFAAILSSKVDSHLQIRRHRRHLNDRVTVQQFDEDRLPLRSYVETQQEDFPSFLALVLLVPATVNKAELDVMSTIILKTFQLICTGQRANVKVFVSRNLSRSREGAPGEIFRINQGLVESLYNKGCRGSTQEPRLYVPTLDTWTHYDDDDQGPRNDPHDDESSIHDLHDDQGPRSDPHGDESKYSFAFERAFGRFKFDQVAVFDLPILDGIDPVPRIVGLVARLAPSQADPSAWCLSDFGWFVQSTTINPTSCCSMHCSMAFPVSLYPAVLQRHLPRYKENY